MEHGYVCWCLTELDHPSCVKKERESTVQEEKRREVGNIIPTSSGLTFSMEQMSMNGIVNSVCKEIQ